MASTIASPPPSLPHLVAIPFPLHGHITALLQLCRLLASSGLSITFITSEKTRSSVSESLSHNQALPIRLLSIPNDVPRGDLPFWDYFRVCLHAFAQLEGEFTSVLEQVNTADAPVLGIISDVYLGWTQEVANKFSIPRICLVTASASECYVYYQTPGLMSKGYLPFKAPINGSRSSEADNLIPGMPGLLPKYHRVSRTECEDLVPINGLPTLHRSEFPSLLQIEDASDIIFSYYVDHTRRIPEADKVLFNSFYEFERSVLDVMRPEVNVLPVGPLFLLDENHEVNRKDSMTLSEEDKKCLTWLDSQASASVLYVAFGTNSALAPALVTEIALGLEASEQQFLWALGRSSVPGVSDPLPEGFLDRTKERGVVVSWAPQSLILGHPSVGGFLSHCGWNSTLESMTMGVPMLCCPQAADQILTCKLMVDVWKAGLRLGGTVEEGTPKREEVERAARVLLREEEGKQARQRARELSDAARNAVNEEGGAFQAELESSHTRLQIQAPSTLPQVILSYN